VNKEAIRSLIHDLFQSCFFQNAISHEPIIRRLSNLYTYLLKVGSTAFYVSGQTLNIPTVKNVKSNKAKAAKNGSAVGILIEQFFFLD
jgi:hypothetical protein